jgi:hypothetical protein
MMDPFCPPVRFGDAFGRGSVTATTAWGVPLFRVPSGEQVDRHSSTVLRLVARSQTEITMAIPDSRCG